jgi:uncharacterized membrane protein
MINAYLAFAVTNKFKVTYFGIGPTEVRLVFIILNALIIIFGKIYIVWFLPYVAVISLIALILIVYQTQKYMRDLDKK